ncbi:MAG TPA: peptide ligase PGM1-related protein [Acidimicrobiales bacterium]|nr:peptide ligase PGM1-related protein [Acidimicrobiales bacterium]
MAELAKITAVGRYEERMLFAILQLSDPRQRLVYVTSQAVDPAIVDYYLRFVPDPDGARSRLTMVSVDDPDLQPLSQKLLSRPEVVGRLRDLAGDPAQAHIVPFNVGGTDQALADALDLPLLGPRPELAWLGSKSGARQVARRAGVAVLPGAEDLFSVEELDAAVAALRHEHPEAESVVIKLNNGFSGQGNAMIALETVVSGESVVRSPTTFCASEESWPSFVSKTASEGAIVEELVRRPGLTSPSVQLRISVAGELEVLSTHDQVLGGPGQQVYLGCRFPADAVYRNLIREEALKVGGVLVAEKVIGSFGIDFLVIPDDDAGARVYLSEINLRAGGTTHPFWMARLATGATYDDASGELLVDGTAKSYMASDNVKSDALVGVTPARMIEAFDQSGLAFDPNSGRGTTLHLLGALPGHGKMGLTCIADSREDADELYKQAVEVAIAAR